MKIGFYAGSFDPFTIGHFHIVKTASKLFDKVYVGIGINPQKNPRYNREDMKNAINLLFKNQNLNNCECILFEGLTADTATKMQASYLIRGLRNGMDYEFEENLALINQEISGLDTIYIRAGKFGAISSSMVYELIKNNKNTDNYLPKEINDLIHKV